VTWADPVTAEWPTSSERGAALALLLLLIMAITGLGVGALAVSRRQAVSARTGERVLQAKTAAESGLRLAESEWDPWPELLVGQSGPKASGSMGVTGMYRTMVQRLAPELWLVEAVGTHVRSGAQSRTASVTWRLHPPTRVGLQGAAIVHGEGLTVTSSAGVTVVDAQAVPVGWPSDACARFEATVDSLFPDGALRLDARLLSGESAWDDQGRLRPFDPLPRAGELPGLGLIPLDSLIEVGGALTPSLDPADPPCPSIAEGDRTDCGSVAGVLAGTGDMTIHTGSAAGIIAFDGDLILTGDVKIAGWVLTSGSLTLRQDSRIDGFVRAMGAVHVLERATVVASPCAGLAALGDSWFRRPRPVPGGSQLGPLP
jgi:hypothetical protein